MTPRRSALDVVDLLAWSFIVLAALGILITGGQLVMLHASSYVDDMRRTMHDFGLMDHVPPVMMSMLSHMELIAAVTLALSGVTLAASIGVLKRHEWARLVFIALMAVGIVWNVVGVFFQRAVLSQLSLPGHPPPEVQAQFESLRSIMMGVSIGVVIAFSLAFAWTIWWMCRADVVAAFRSEGRGLRTED